MTVFIATAALVIAIVLAFCVAVQQRMIEGLNRKVVSTDDSIGELLNARSRDKASLDALKAQHESTHRMTLQVYNDMYNTPVEGKHADGSND